MTSDDSELLEVCRRLVAFDTVSTASNAACADYVADLLDDAGWQVRAHRDHLLGVDKVNLVAWAGPPAGRVAADHRPAARQRAHPPGGRPLLFLTPRIG